MHYGTTRVTIAVGYLSMNSDSVNSFVNGTERNLNWWGSRWLRTHRLVAPRPCLEALGWQRPRQKTVPSRWNIPFHIWWRVCNPYEGPLLLSPLNSKTLLTRGAAPADPCVAKSTQGFRITQFVAGLYPEAKQEERDNRTKRKKYASAVSNDYSPPQVKNN